MTVAINTANFALAARGLLPIDGHCSCPACKRNGLGRDDMIPNDGGPIWQQSQEVYGRPICTRQFCADLLYLEWEDLQRPPRVKRRKCPECNGTGGSVRVSDYVRGDRTEFCVGCNGYGSVGGPL